MMILCNASKHSMKDFRNSRYMKIFRKAIKENDKSILNETCKTCIKQEQAVKNHLDNFI